MKLKMPRMGGLPMPETSLPKVPGAPASPKTTSPMKVGEQATVKMPKSKKMADATDKPSVFYKTENGSKKLSVENLRTFIENKKQKRQSSQSNERLSMDHDKKISAREAAQAVLKKAHELLSASKLAKNDFRDKHVKGVHIPMMDGMGLSNAGNKARPWSGEKSGSVDAQGAKEAHKKVLNEIKTMPKPDLGKTEEKDVTPADGVQAQGAPAENYNGNPAPGATPKNLGENYKGHLKLAKWVGRMEQKRAAKKAAPAPAEAEASTEKPKAE